MFLSRTSAALEASLSSHAFVYLISVTFAITLALIFLNGARTEFRLTDHKEMRWVAAIARGTGSTLNITTSMALFVCSRLLLTVVRSTPLIFVFPVDVLFPVCHVFIGYFVFLTAIIHSVAHIIRMIVMKSWEAGFGEPNMAFATGLALLIVLIVIVAFAHRWVRKRHFHIFHIVHSFFAILFYALLLFHGLHNGEFMSYKFLMLPMALYAAEVIMRRWKVRKYCFNDKRVSTSQRGAVMRIQLPRSFSFKPGQYAGKFYSLFCANGEQTCLRTRWFAMATN